ncbi:DEAD/DEAH box helicase [Celeribacter neptunius]|uniref:ATP-dependent RNA helicase DeaD n=1 Tax=Celeribacter neptunius TaxID=588602 RepID=A0A1I3UQD3_9RHOB|nr:DEAD/DEAH box helicase [Celeribacter neptunius]SFJ84929.1 ATP-dependent RNA helicase DeaD [Celeribacter neptunius]
MLTPLSDALAERGYDKLTDVQTAVTAPELAEADLLVSAQTGSGKTVGFGLAIAPTLLGEAEHFEHAGSPLALIVAPTRELAMQVARELMWLYGKAGARISTCIGGMDARNERRSLERGAHIVVGTPGRLRDHIMRGALDLSAIRAVVLDEADEMLDLGFREDLEFMLGEAPEDRRTLLFSATVSKSIAEIAKTYQRDAVRITTIAEKSQHSDISYEVIQCAPRDAEHAIINLLRFHDSETSIVFANTRAAVARLTARFANRGFSVVSLSGELSQDERSHALQALRDGRAKVCVATDVAARGIDLPNLELVIHADLPTNTEGLLHRSGRTGRAGRKGTSVLIAPDNISKKAARLLKWAKIDAEWKYAPTAEEIFALDEARIMDDPAWAEELNDADHAFAAKLLERFSAEQVAAACLRLYRAGLSAPEELNVHTAKRPQDPRAAFGPSKWVSLSVGRDQNAEPRWLLPLLCRAGNLDKTAIGKIKMEDSETFVELKEEVVAGFLDRLGAGGELEDGVKATPVEGVPTFSRGPAKPRGPRSFDKPRGPRGDRPKYDRPKYDKPRETARGEASFGEKPRHDGEKTEKYVKPARKERDEAVHAPAKAPRREKTQEKPKGKPAGEGKPRKPRAKSRPNETRPNETWDKKGGGKFGAKSGPAGKGKKPHRKGGGAKAAHKGGDAVPVRKR